MDEPVTITLSGPRRSETFSPLTSPPKSENAARQRRARARQYGEDEPPTRPEDIPDDGPEPEVALTDDLAATVVKRTMSRLASGELKPNLRDGLIAQQLLDRREEKAADRQFMLSLAQALAGGGYSPPTQLLPATTDTPDEVIEGYFEEVSLAPDHLRQK